MTKGGYQILDLGDRNLTSGAGVTIKGIYEKIEGNRKRLVLSGLVIDGIEQRDMEVYVTLIGTNYHLFNIFLETEDVWCVRFLTETCRVIITQDDLVTISVI